MSTVHLLLFSKAGSAKQDMRQTAVVLSLQRWHLMLQALFGMNSARPGFHLLSAFAHGEQIPPPRSLQKAPHQHDT